MAHGDSKDLRRGTTSYNVLRDKAFNIAKNLLWISKRSCFYGL